MITDTPTLLPPTQAARHVPAVQAGAPDPPCCPTHRLRDISQQDKLEHQRTVKDLEKHVSALQLLKEEKDKVDTEMQEAQEVIDELQEQVDAALGAEEMVEKLTDKNLEQERTIQKLNDNIS